MYGRLTQLAVVVAVAVMVALAFWQHWHVLAASPYPVGIDGYFYPTQLRSLLEHGTLQYPSSPFTFWFMAPFAAATDPITGAKLGAALGTALIAVPAYGVGARLGDSRGAGLLAAAVASASASSAYLPLEFVKQGLGLTVALTALWCFVRLFDQPTRTRAIVAAVAFVVTLLTHKLAAGVVVAIAAPVAIVELRARLRGRRLIYLVVACAALALVLVILGLVAPQRFVSPADLALVGKLFTRDAHWAAPALVTPHLVLRFGNEALVGGVVALVAITVLVAQSRGPGWQPSRMWWVVLAIPIAAIWGIRKLATLHQSETLPVAKIHGARSSTAIMAWIVAGFGLVIALPWLDVTDPQGLGFRLRVAAFVPLALSAAIVARGLLAWAAPYWRDGILATVAAALVTLAMQAPRTEGEVLTHPALAAAVMAATDQIPSNATVIVPERHILFMVAWYTRAPVSLRPEPIPYAQRVRLFGLAFIHGPSSPLDHALDAARRDPAVVAPIGLHSGHRNGLVLVTEPTWDWLLAHLPPRDHDEFAAWPTI